MNKGFSLIELAIVLVILGLLTGGILTGQNLIRAAELRSVTSQLEAYNAAVYTFQDKYFALPGDLTNATDFWGSAGGDGEASSAGCNSGTFTGTQTCNGNGSGVLESYGVGVYAERFGFWQHLANAGLIEGTYNPVSGTGSSSDSLVGINVPATKFGDGGITVASHPGFSGSGHFYDMPAAVQFFVGVDKDPGSTRMPLFRPEEAWNIDTKLDDSKPGTGKIRSFKSTSGDTPGCSTSDDPSTAEYAVSSDNVLCSFIYIIR
jgi:prepilin-type N-terminal cleavage/methylation domain-containing protein